MNISVSKINLVSATANNFTRSPSGFKALPCLIFEEAVAGKVGQLVEECVKSSVHMYVLNFRVGCVNFNDDWDEVLRLTADHSTTFELVDGTNSFSFAQMSSNRPKRPKLEPYLD